MIGPLQRLDCFLFHSILWCAAVFTLILLHDLSQALAFRLMALHLTTDYFGIKRSSKWTQWLLGVQVMWLENKPKSLPICHCVTSENSTSTFREGFVLMCCVWFSTQCIMAQYIQCGLICPRPLFQKCFVSRNDLFRCRFTNLNHAAIFQREEATLPNEPLTQFYSNCTVMNFRV